MNGIDPARLLDPVAFGKVFDAARHSVFRWEGFQTYAVADDDDELVAFRTGAPRPERSVRTSPWLRRIAVQTARGVSWSRLRVIAYPLTEYTRFELLAFVESQAAGEQIRLIESAPGGAGDFWLIDGGTEHAVAVVMHYDDAGHLLGREQTTDPGMIDTLTRSERQGWAAGTPLNVWLAEAASA